MLIDLLVQWEAVQKAGYDLDAQIGKHLPPEGDERVEALQVLLREHGRTTPTGYAIDLYLVRQEIIARRLRAREKK